MNDVLADTHTAVWSPFEPARLSPAALQALQAAEAAGGRILVSAISPVEIVCLNEKGKLPVSTLTGLWTAIDDPTNPFGLVPLAVPVARVFDQIPRAVVPDMPDRIIATTALAFGVPLVSTDQKIRALKVPGLTVIWGVARQGLSHPARRRLSCDGGDYSGVEARRDAR